MQASSPSRPPGAPRSADPAAKIRDWDGARLLARDRQARGERVVFTNGCFDLVHVGHVRYLAAARALGDALIVGVNTDRMVAALKGPERPVLPEDERAELLASLECVDCVVLFDEPNPLSLIRTVEPDILVKGGDWTPETTVGRDVVEARGGRVVILPYVTGASTTDLVKRIRAL